LADDTAGVGERHVYAPDSRVALVAVRCDADCTARERTHRAAQPASPTRV